MSEQKKTYIKPEISKIDLVAEEAVLGTGCKVSPGGKDFCDPPVALCTPSSIPGS